MNFDKLIDVLGKIKDLPRTGWCKRRVENPESVADHSYGVALLSYLLCPEHLNKQKCLEYAIIHDLAEIVVGDITPGDNVPPEIKHKMETEAIVQIAQDLNSPELAELFMEYEEQKTPESNFIKRLDRFDAVALAKYYDANKRSDYFDNLFDEWSTNHREMISPIMEMVEKK